MRSHRIHSVIALTIIVLATACEGSLAPRGDVGATTDEVRRCGRWGERCRSDSGATASDAATARIDAATATADGGVIVAPPPGIDAGPGVDCSFEVAVVQPMTPIEVPCAGPYRLIGRVYGRDEANNGFFVDIDADPTGDVRRIWDIDVASTFGDQDVSRRGSCDHTCADEDPWIVSLTRGAHQLYVAARPDELGARIETMRFVPATSTMLDAGTAVGDAGSATPDAGTATRDAGPIDLECDRSVTPAEDLAAIAESAAAGTVLCLSAGDHGTLLLDVARSSEVVLRSATARDASLAVQIRGAANFRFRSLTIEWLDLSGSATDRITVEASTFTGQAVLRMEGSGDHHVRIDGSTFDGIDVCDDCYEGRLEILGGSGTPVGVTVTNCHFGARGESDGIQIGAYGAVIGPGNVFDGIVQGSYGRHVDAIQLYGQSHTVITGNYFVNNDVQIMSPDGGDAEVVTHNVFVGGSYGPSIQFGSVSDLVFTHNTVIGVSVHIDKKSERPDVSTNARVFDNIMVRSDFATTDGSGTPSCIGCVFDHNLFSSSGAARGTATIIGMPTFTDGTAPTTWAGYRLTTTSLGYRAASDGADVGSNLLP
jgi:hypothetical protein